MTEVSERYIVDEHGAKIDVIVSIESYQQMLDDVEELESIKMYDLAKSTENEILSFDEAMTEIGL
jgi:hypothetical protein